MLIFSRENIAFFHVKHKHKNVLAFPAPVKLLPLDLYTRGVSLDRLAYTFLSACVVSFPLIVKKRLQQIRDEARKLCAVLSIFPPSRSVLDRARVILSRPLPRLTVVLFRPVPAFRPVKVPPDYDRPNLSPPCC